MHAASSPLKLNLRSAPRATFHIDQPPSQNIDLPARLRPLERPQSTEAKLFLNFSWSWRLSSPTGRIRITRGRICPQAGAIRGIQADPATYRFAARAVSCACSASRWTSSYSSSTARTISEPREIRNGICAPTSLLMRKPRSTPRSVGFHQVLRDRPGSPRFIGNYPAKGYRLVAAMTA